MDFRASIRRMANINEYIIFCFYRILHIIGDVLFSTKPSSPYDLALVQMRDSVVDAVIPQMAKRINQGLL